MNSRCRPEAVVGREAANDRSKADNSHPGPNRLRQMNVLTIRCCPPNPIPRSSNGLITCLSVIPLRNARDQGVALRCLFSASSRRSISASVQSGTYVVKPFLDFYCSDESFEIGGGVCDRIGCDDRSGHKDAIWYQLVVMDSHWLSKDRLGRSICLGGSPVLYTRCCC